MKDTDQIHTKDTEEQGITLPYLKKQLFFYYIWFLRVNMAFALQSAMMGRIFQTLGADPNNLGWFYFAAISRNDCTTTYWILF